MSAAPIPPGCSGHFSTLSILGVLTLASQSITPGHLTTLPIQLFLLNALLAKNFEKLKFRIFYFRRLIFPHFLSPFGQKFRTLC